MDIQGLTLTDARQALLRGEVTPEALQEACLAQIRKLNPRLNAFITVLEEKASGSRIVTTRKEQILFGLPVAVKDLYETRGIRTTAGSWFFSDYIPTGDAESVRRIREAGAILLGKTNTHEIALGVTNINPTFANCLNPWDTRRIPGGSSGGSAAAVASGMALAALGTDTGGSIRIPASLCGVTGLKPTYGRVSLRGIFPLSWNLDHAGPLAKSARDAALLLQVLAGYDPEDPASVNVPVDDYLANIDHGIKGWKVARTVGAYIEASDAEVLAAVGLAAGVLRSLGAIVEDVEVPWLREAALANTVMTQADGAAFHQDRLKEHPERFGADVRSRLEMGANYTSTEYALARRTQTVLRREAEKFFAEYDLLLLPSTPIPAPLVEGTDALEQARRLTRFTAPFNLTGLPAISVPCGFSSEGLPLGLQMISAHWSETKILQAAQAYESATRWSEQRRPPI